MLGITLSTALLITAPTTAPATPAPVQDAPPGMVPVKGERTKVGTPVKDIEALIETHGAKRGELASETPQHTVKVEDFHLMVTELTNEQYLAYVEATGVKPPHHWANPEALTEARNAFFEEGHQRQLVAEETNQRYERRIFAAHDWWRKAWTETEWEMSTDIAAHPVVNVTYYDAEAYAIWAGVRLMTEQEFQCAARGDDDRIYPWGDEWDDKRFCASILYERDQTLRVGSFPEGESNGLYDLVGNVWEWTQSPYVAYPGYELIRK